MNGEALFAEYRETGSEAVFAQLVSRYVDLVYSVALRLVQGDSHLAEDVAQTVFADLASKARKLPADLMLGGWLHRNTCFIAGHIMRGERRRSIRERQAAEMNASLQDPGPEFSAIAPIIDQAINSLDEPDRTVILLRFFEHRDLQSVGKAIGTSEDAARMRVNRALNKLESVLARHGITSTAAALSIALTAGAVHAAPAGLAVAISTGATVTAAAAATTTLATTATQAIAMTTLQKLIVTTALVVVTGAGVYQARNASELRREVRALKEENAPLLEQIHALQAERAEFSNQIALLSEENAALKQKPTEVLKLRGEVGRLQQEKSALGRTAALSKMTETPAARELVRQQQKAGMGAIYKKFGERVGLPAEKADQFHDLLANNIMESIDLITTVLRDGNSPAEVDRLFDALESQHAEKVRELLSAEEYAQYEQYTRNLLSLFSADQFGAKLTGDVDARRAKANQLYDVMTESTRAVLNEYGLSPGYQTLPILNLRNIALPVEAERSLKIMEAIYNKAAQGSASFMSPEELESFARYREEAIKNSQTALELNRKMMEPLGQ